MPASSTSMNFIGNALGTNVGTLSTPNPDSNGWYCTNIVAAGNASYFNDAVARWYYPNDTVNTNFTQGFYYFSQIYFNETGPSYSKMIWMNGIGSIAVGSTATDTALATRVGSYIYMNTLKSSNFSKVS